MTVRLVKLTTGEEVIFNTGNETADTVEMKKAMLVRVVPQGQESYGLALIPYSPSMPDAVHTLNKHSVVSQCGVDVELEKVYLQQTSGLEIVSSL